MKPDMIMACITGSRLYGTSRPDSDTDIRGVCHQPIESLLGLTGFEQYQPSGHMFGVESDDITIYGVSKFVSLAIANNPNILELLFVPKSHMLYSNDIWETIVNHRWAFVSTKVVHSFAGYAYSQLKRIKTHYKWLHNVPQKPNPEDYGMFQSDKGGQHWKDDTMKKAYDDAIANYQHYVKWKSERNLARAKLEEEYGFDTKCASHLYRLSLEAEELLTIGKITLPLKPEYLDVVLAVLHGNVPYDDIINHAEQLKDKLKVLESKSGLRKKPNQKALNEMLMDINYRHIIENGKYW